MPMSQLPVFGLDVAGAIYQTKSNGGPMSRFNNLLDQFVRDDEGGEVIEYALVLGLISVAAIAVIGSFGLKVLARWNSVNSSM
jgi:Flp pilus assembly pilin Flp